MAADDVAPALTLDRLEEIQRGIGDLATEHELGLLAIWNARTASIWNKLRPQVVEVLSDLEASGYDKLPLGERRRYRHWTPKAFLLYRQQACRRNWTTPRTRAPRGRRVRSSRASRGAPARKRGGSDDPHPCPDVALLGAA